MVLTLLTGHETLVKAARGALRKADEIGDDATVDLMTQRAAASEKAAWMLRATAESGE
jgi:starvation-inducible DNA-binding protein